MSVEGAPWVEGDGLHVVVAADSLTDCACSSTWENVSRRLGDADRFLIF
ncbi:hypothetical protein A2U01_0083903, partial [Trifolium medium]|nr:hypothetical protein [Trifolium medium]